MITIVVPSRTDAYLDRLLPSLERSAPGWMAQRAEAGQPGVVVVDNGLSEELRRRWTPWVQFVPLSEPFIFGKAMNVGVAAAAAESDLVLMNDDTEILSDGFVQALEALLASPATTGYAVLSPGIVGGVGNPLQEQQLPAGIVDTIETTVCFVCVLIPRRAWDLVGPMDESFTGYGSDDDDWNTRARARGMRCGVVGGVLVRHGFADLPMNGTYARLYDRATLTGKFHEAQRTFVQKWGHMPTRIRQLQAGETGPRGMSLAEFRRLGYLQELNRVFLHPLGLSMFFRIDHRGVTTFGGITDDRDDPEGVVFAPGVIDSILARRIEEELLERGQARTKALGFFVQPVDVSAQEG